MRRPWYELVPDRKIHGIHWFTDEEAIERLEEYLAGKGPKWVPIAGFEQLRETLTADLQNSEQENMDEDRETTPTFGRMSV